MKRFPKVLYLCLALALLLAPASAAGAAEEAQSLYWNFLRDDYTGLKISGSGGAVSTEENALVFRKTGEGALQALIEAYPTTGKLTGTTVVELDIFTSADKFLVYFQNLTGGSLLRMQRNAAGDSVRLNYSQNGANTYKDLTFTNDVWHEIKMVLDYPNKTGTLYIDDVPCLEHVSYMTAANGYGEYFNTTLIQHNGVQGELRIRNFAVYNKDDRSAARVSYDALSLPDRVETDQIALPAAVKGDSEITWASSDPERIDPQTGQVRLPSAAEGPRIVTLTASIRHGDVTLTKAFEVTAAARMTDAERTQADLAAIAVPEVLYDEVSLPAVGGNGSVITWTAVPAGAFQIPDQPDGETWRITTRRTEANIDAVLTAAVCYDTSRLEKPYPVQVCRIMTDAASVEEDLKLIQLPAPVEEGVVLPAAGRNGSAITWRSGDEARIVIQDGTIHLVTSWPDETQVTLTATAVKNAAVKSQEFTVLLAGDETGSLVLLNEAVEKLTLSPTSDVTGDLNLPSLGANDTSITWSSGNSTVISDTGRVTRPANGTTVTLTAVLERGSQTREKAFRISVRGTGGTSHPSGGSGGGGRSPGGSAAVRITREPDETLPGQEPAMPDQPAAPADAFSDVPRDHWASAYIKALSETGLVQGSQGRFEPERQVTREEFVKMTVLAMGAEAAGGAARQTFSDVEPGAWYAGYVETACAQNWIQGISADRFGVGEYLTREQAAVILWRMLDLPAKGELDFQDRSEISAYAAGAVAGLAASGLVGGDDAGCFRPSASLTRAEAAKLVWELTEAVGRTENEE